MQAPASCANYAITIHCLLRTLKSIWILQLINAEWNLSFCNINHPPLLECWKQGANIHKFHFFLKSEDNIKSFSLFNSNILIILLNLKSIKVPLISIIELLTTYHKLPSLTFLKYVSLTSNDSFPDSFLPFFYFPLWGK